MTARSRWHSETWVTEEVVAIWNILDFPINRKSAREELMQYKCDTCGKMFHYNTQKLCHVAEKSVKCQTKQGDSPEYWISAINIKF